MADGDAPIRDAFVVRVRIEVDEEDLERQIADAVSRATDGLGASIGDALGTAGAPRGDAGTQAQEIAEAVQRAMEGLLDRLPQAQDPEGIESPPDPIVAVDDLKTMVVDSEQLRILDDILEQLNRLVALIEEGRDE